jgi:hypothetical protein
MVCTVTAQPTVTDVFIRHSNYTQNSCRTMRITFVDPINLILLRYMMDKTQSDGGKGLT